MTCHFTAESTLSRARTSRRLLIENGRGRVYTLEVSAYLKQHFERRKPLVQAAARSGDREPGAAPDLQRDVTEQIRAKARELGFGEVGFTRSDRGYTYVSKKQWVRYPHAVCLALEQDYVATQTLPSLEAEHAHFGAYEEGGRWSWNWPSTFAPWATTLRCTVRATAAALTWPCSWLRASANWEPTASFCPLISAPERGS